MATEQPQDREIPIAVVNWVLAYVHVKLAGNPEEDIEDVVQNTLLGLVQAMKDWDSPIDAWTALARTIASRRIADYQRAQYRKVSATSLSKSEADFADPRNAIEDLIEDEWLRKRVDQIKSALKEVAKGDPVDEELVTIFLAKLEHDRRFPSFSAVGAEAGLSRQTACPRLTSLFERALDMLGG